MISKLHRIEDCRADLHACFYLSSLTSATSCLTINPAFEEEDSLTQHDPPISIVLRTTTILWSTHPRSIDDLQALIDNLIETDGNACIIEVRIFVYETAGFRWVLVLPHRFSPPFSET
jgi:hypothetical protein